MAKTAERQRQRPSTPRIIVYHQTHTHDGTPVSILPLIAHKTAVTHVIIAAIHLNAVPSDITINNDAWDSSAHDALRSEARALQAHGVKVLGMLGGAAQGTFARLDTPLHVSFHAYYQPLREVVAELGLDGLDLDVEEPVSLEGIQRLILQLRADFGPGFLVTLAPVATALQGGARAHLSGFDYAALERSAAGREVAWYNAQFYNGWGSAATGAGYDEIVAAGWDPARVVLGLPTSPEVGRGWVPDGALRATLAALARRYPRFGGVMGWEYFGSVTVAEPGGWPWSWAKLMTSILRPLEGDLAVGTVSLEQVMVDADAAAALDAAAAANAHNRFLGNVTSDADAAAGGHEQNLEHA